MADDTNISRVPRKRQARIVQWAGFAYSDILIIYKWRTGVEWISVRIWCHELTLSQFKPTSAASGF